MRHATDPDPDPAGTTSMRPSADSHVKRQNKQETNIHKYNTIVVKTQNKRKKQKKIQQTNKSSKRRKHQQKRSIRNCTASKQKTLKTKKC